MKKSGYRFYFISSNRSSASSNDGVVVLEALESFDESSLELLSTVPSWRSNILPVLNNASICSPANVSYSNKASAIITNLSLLASIISFACA